MDSQNIIPLIEHEFRDLLNASDGVTQVISSLVKKAVQSQELINPATLKKHVQKLEQIQLDFNRLLTMLSDCSDLEQEKIKPDIQAIDFPQLLERVAHPFKLRAKEKNVAFDIDYHEEASSIVYGDSLRVSQILYHILDNAVKFTSSGSIYVVVSSSWSASAKNQTLQVSVIDTGTGIEPDKLQQVFNQFLKLNPGAGLGFGLVACKTFC